MTQTTEQAVRSIVQEVLSQLGHSHNGSNGYASQDGDWGAFTCVDAAVAASQQAFEQLSESPIAIRDRATQIVKDICFEQAEELGRMELEETKIGRLDHKIEKLLGIRNIPGVEFLKCDAVSGDKGLTVTEYAPFGVIGAITPVTHSLPTLACNFVNMVAAGNTVLVNPHPSGKNVAVEGVKRFNKAIYEELGLKNLITIISEPTLESADAIFNHRGVSLLVVTGGPGVARAALSAKKRAIVAGPGNPPVVVDETAELDNAARSIIAGAAYDNNLLCIGEKEVFAVDSIFDQLMDEVGRNGGYRLNAEQIARLTEIAIVPAKEPGGHAHAAAEFIGKDPAVLGQAIGVQVPAGTQILYGETDTSNPFVPVEQMMPFVPFVRCRDADHGIALALEFEHGFGHTAVLHSTNIKVMTKMGRAVDTTLFIKNGPCTAALGGGGEGYASFSIATPTGEGVTNPMTFTRQRRCTLAGDLRII